MDIDTCIEKYQDLSEAVFEPRRSKINVFGKARDTWKLEGAFDSERLATEIRHIVQENQEDSNAKLLESDPQCKV
jgi:hypothetical protein